METQFKLSELPITITEIWDEDSGDTVLTFVTRGENGISGFLELNAYVHENGLDGTGWKWIVTEPSHQECYTGQHSYLIAAAEELKAAMIDMAEFIKKRDG